MRCDCGFGFATSTAAVYREERARLEEAARKAKVRVATYALGATALSVAWVMVVGYVAGLACMAIFGLAIVLTRHSLVLIVDTWKSANPSDPRV
ncbi:MAG: hypothetical protein U0Q11_24935 [Vicinamibacterales bacterium]